MDVEYVTTPFGRRPMTFGMLKSQIDSQSTEPKKSVDKWKLYRALCQAKPLLGVSDRALTVLNALLSFYPKNELSKEAGLIVFPSNAQLSLRAHGMAEQTIRRHLVALVNAGLLIRKDSPNGKRYAHKGEADEVREAFGFSLAALLARSEEIEAMAAKVVAAQLRLRRLRERLTLCRRDISKLIEVASENASDRGWETISAYMQGLIEHLPRVPTAVQLESVLGDMTALREEVVNKLELQLNPGNLSGNPYQNERHIQSSETNSNLESETSHELEKINELISARTEQTRDEINDGQEHSSATTNRDPVRSRTKAEGFCPKSYPLDLVLQACPQISDYAKGGAIHTWRDLMSAAVVVRSMLGVSSSAHEEAAAVLGPENAATAIACILERVGHINSAGGYLRDLTRRAELGTFTLGPMIMALRKPRDSSFKRALQPDAAGKSIRGSLGSNISGRAGHRTMGAM